MAITTQAVYTNNTPWYTTSIVNDRYLDVLNIRPVSASPSDYLYTIQPQYTYRPDLLAYDLYGDAKLWWVFIQRNLDVLQDPILDFVPGTQIYICQFSQLKVALGI
jgi:Base plate wedge protein 53